MTRFVIGWLSVAALATLACASSTRSAKAGSGAASATAPAAANETKPSGTASAAGGSADASPAGEAARQIVGRVELLNRANEVTLSGTERVGLAFEKFKIDDGTKITVNGERASVADVNAGDEVRASFSGKGDEAHLDRLEVLPSGE